MCKRCDECRAVLVEWAGYQGHDRCWYYPELFRRLVRILGVDAPVPPELPRPDFERGCRRFQDEEYGAETAAAAEIAPPESAP